MFTSFDFCHRFHEDMDMEWEQGSHRVVSIPISVARAEDYNLTNDTASKLRVQVVDCYAGARAVETIGTMPHL